MAQDIGALKAKILMESQQFSQGMKQAREELSKTGKSSQQLGKDFNTIQKASLAVGGAVVAGLGASVGVAANFEQAMARVKAVSGATGSDFEALEKIAKDMGKSTEFSASQAAEALTYLSMAGFSVEDQIAALPSVLNAASAGQIDLARSADIVSNIMSGFGISAEDTGAAVDVLVKTMTTANTDLPMLGEAFKYVGPVAASLGLSIEDTATAIAKMSDAGIQGSQAGTALRAALLSLVNPKTEKDLKKLGIEIIDTSGKMKPLPELIGDISEKFDGMTKAQKTQLATQLVGQEAVSGFLSLLEVGEDGLKDYSKELKNAGGTAEKVAKTQMNTLKGSFKEFQSALEGLGIEIGDELLPHFTEIVKKGTEIIGALSKMDAASVKSALAFGGTTAAIALTLSTIGKLGLAIKAFTASMGPVGLLITGISLLGGAYAATKFQQEEAIEVNLDHAKSLEDQTKLLDDQIERYDTLQEKNKLSNKELDAFVDLQSRIALETDPKKIEEMQKEYERLQKKSGLTNEELAEFLGLNDDIIEKVPTSNARLTDQGKVMLDNTEAAKEYNKQLEKELEIELRKQANAASSSLEEKIQARTDALEEQNKLAEDYLRLQKDIETQKMRVGTEEAKLIAARASGDEAEIAAAEHNYEQEQSKLKVLEDQKYEMSGQIIEQEEIINNAELQIKKGQEAYQELIKYRLEQIGVVAEKGKQLEAIDKAITKTKKLRDEKLEEFKADGKITAEEQKQLDKLEEKLTLMGLTKEEVATLIKEQDRLTGSIDDSVGVAQDLNLELDKDIEKWLTQKGFTLEDAKNLNAELGKSIRKEVLIRQVQGQSLKRMPGLDYASPIGDNSDESRQVAILSMVMVKMLSDYKEMVER